MSCDKLVYDLSSETEGSPNVFVRKDWINILDNQTSNYQSNQSIVDTSQLSNSNKWMSYREAYLEIPLLLTLASSATGVGAIRTAAGTGTGVAGFKGYSSATGNFVSADAVVGLKNWFGQIIHSFTLDYNGTTIIQQTPFINMWNSFKLMTTLSWADVKTQGAHIGFYPDSSLSWHYSPTANAVNAAYTSDGDGVSNNRLITSDKAGEFGPFTPSASSLGQGMGNIGYMKRMQYIAYDPKAIIGTSCQPGVAADIDSTSILPDADAKNMWRTYITGAVGGAGVGYVQYQIMATVYLKHIHSFFNMVPLLKGVYMKMTMNLNQSSATITALAGILAAGPPQTYTAGGLRIKSVSNAVGGVVPFMVSSAYAIDQTQVDATVFPVDDTVISGGAPLTYFGGASETQDYYVNLSVGSTVLDTSITGLTGGISSGNLAKSIYLYVPAYTFNPVFEQAYLSSPVKTVKYTDVYQYQVSGVQGTFNQLITNGIANIKSVLILPFLAKGASGNGTAIGCASYQSPFDPAGCGPTDPLCAINNFNVVVSGQNAIYNTERYTFEHFVNQVYGQNAVNGGLTDGLTSSLINFKDWQSSYCYYYTNVERMLPVEQTVPKSVFIQGVIQGLKTWDLWVFIEYGTQIQIDAITGARV